MLKPALTIDPENTLFSVKKIFEEIKDLLLPYTNEKELLFDIETSQETNTLIVSGDLSGLRQILMCLLSNAVKFTFHGRIEVKVSHKRLSNELVELQFSVKDTGIGINKNDVAKVFTAFSVPSPGTDTSQQKLFAGFGLALCKQLVKNLGGEISVVSEPGAGSEFKVTIPFHSEETMKSAHEKNPAVKKDQSQKFKTEVLMENEISLDGQLAGNSVTPRLFNLDQLNKIGNNSIEFVKTMLEKFSTTSSENTENMVTGLASGNFSKLMGAAHKSIPSFHMLGLNELVKQLQYIEFHAKEGADLTDLTRSVQLVQEETRKINSEIRKYLDSVGNKKTEKVIS